MVVVECVINTCMIISILDNSTTLILLEIWDMHLCLLRHIIMVILYLLHTNIKISNLLDHKNVLATPYNKKCVTLINKELMHFRKHALIFNKT